jgi:hypothetical protein
VPDLQAGNYGVTITASGFSDVQSRVVLTVGAQQVLNVQMKVREVAQRVEVTAAAASVELDQLHRRRCHGFGHHPWVALEWQKFGRNLATLQPGAAVIRTQQPVGQGGAPRGTRGLGEQLSISGACAARNTYRLDGIVQNDYANSTPGLKIIWRHFAGGVEQGRDDQRCSSLLTVRKPDWLSAMHGNICHRLRYAPTHGVTNTFRAGESGKCK